MVGTMSLLRSLLGTARTVRPAVQPSDGLPPDDAVLLDAPDGRLGPALVAAALGDHIPAARLMAATRRSAEWEDRDRYAVRLAAFARSRDAWLTGWLAEAPGDPDALLVAAQLAVQRAWESPARAERLRDVEPMIRAAAEAAPRDPVPWRLALDHARGTHVPHTVFAALWEQALRRAAHHYGCHVSALEYLSARWYGSHRACFDFAEQAALDARPGSLIQTLPLRAAFIQQVSGDAARVPDARVDAAADLAIGLSARHRAGDPWPAEMRNTLAYVLVARGRWTAALEQFRLIGPCATSFPWSLGPGDPLGGFLDARQRVRREVAGALVPLRGRAGRGRPGDHYA
ncbi:hypothetical protein ACFPM3_32030 [Streptomyces coeruleoprunus]|uniref:DUF4034 domain-containing protein n=1 Tax=Streptomyces coeruleoprunus TaxID=285563 RepID=A0ABV9XQJ2_9ACTN